MIEKKDKILNISLTKNSKSTPEKAWKDLNKWKYTMFLASKIQYPKDFSSP